MEKFDSRTAGAATLRSKPCGQSRMSVSAECGSARTKGGESPTTFASFKAEGLRLGVAGGVGESTANS